MRSEWRLFGLLSALLFVAAIVYAFGTRGSDRLHHVEWVGATALVLSGLLCTMCFLYFAVVARRIDLRPEDRSDAEISDGAGEVGFFSPGSYWPVGIALAALVAGLGLVYWQGWVLGLGLRGVLATGGGRRVGCCTGAGRGGGRSG